MTLQLRRKRPTITVPRWMRISALAALACLPGQVRASDAAADDAIELPAPSETHSLPPLDGGAAASRQAPPRRLPTLAADPSRSFEDLHRSVMRSVSQGRVESEVEFVQAQAPAQQPGATYGFRASTEPPSRERLFRVLSPEGYLSALEREYRESGQKGSFFIPLPADVFDAPDSPTLSAIWFQSRRSGRLDPNTQLRGFMRIVDKAVQQDVGNPPEVAIINESVGSPDMWVQLTIQLGGPASRFGVVFRAGEPKQWIDVVDQIEANTYCYAMFTETTVGVYFHKPGREDVLLQSATLPARRAFTAVVAAYEDEIRVVRDGQTVLETSAAPVPSEDWGKYCGMIAGVTEGAPTRADNFFGRRFGGEYVARQWAPSAAVFRGPNVHYHPLYFEQVALERYGQHFGNLFAPWASHALFFADAALWPYSIGKSPPWACHNDVCYHKPGDIVPFRIYSPTCDPRGTVLQATAMALSWSLIP